MENWMSGVEKNEDIVISSRVRLARNIKDSNFPNSLSDIEGREIVSIIENNINKIQMESNTFKTIKLWEEDENEIGILFEKHLISPNLIKSKNKSALITNNDETLSIMVNEEDHLRLQAITKGLNIREAYKQVDRLDNLLDDKLEYCFNEEIGYLTACPTNLGTAMRASVMIHLPVLTMNKEIDGILKGLTQVGMTIRGLYGEGSEADGNIYQISNQVTLGLTEEEIIDNLEAVVTQITTQEIRAREFFRNKYQYEVLDKIYRSLGILRNAVILSEKECLELLSYVRMGVEMAIINDIDKKLLNSLLIITQPASIQKRVGRVLNERERNIERARLVRELIATKEV